MLYYKNHWILLNIFLIFISCNSVPIYQSKLGKNLLENKISIEEIDGDIGFYLSQNLRFSLRDTGIKKEISLTGQLNISKNEYGLSSSNQITRVDLIGTLNCKIKKSDNEHNFTVIEKVSYDISESNVANKAAEQNAKKRLANLLSQTILTDLYHSDLIWIK